MPVSRVAPRHAVVVGAGVAGLSTAWFLLERGIEVTVVDRTGVAAGASWGNAGWLSPALAVPLPEPSALKAGLRVFSPASPVQIRRTPDAALLRFLGKFTRNCTHRRWTVALRTLSVLNRRALDSYDRLAEGGVADTSSQSVPLLLAFAGEQDREPILTELEEVRSVGVDIDFSLLDGITLRQREPALRSRARVGVLLRGQRTIDPPKFLDSLHRAVVGAGGVVVEGSAVTDVHDTGSGVRVVLAGDETMSADVAVLASGGWISRLAGRFGVRMPVQAGRGYSFSMPAEGMPSHPTYFPSQRVVVTPLDGRVRVSGMMELTSPDEPLNRDRIDRILTAARSMVDGVDWSRRSEEWVGPRPCTPDGLPLVGATRSDRVFVCGGHGMWGMTHGPLTGSLLAEQIATGIAPAELSALNPLR